MKKIDKSQAREIAHEMCAHIGILIREERKRQDLTQEDLAEAAGISEKFLSSIENGREPNISIGYLVAISSALEIELSGWLAESEKRTDKR